MVAQISSLLKMVAIICPFYTLKAAGSVIPVFYEHYMGMGNNFTRAEITSMYILIGIYLEDLFFR